MTQKTKLIIGAVLIFLALCKFGILFPDREYTGTDYPYEIMNPYAY